MPEQNNNNGGRKFLKVIGMIGVILLLILIVGFGLIVGACGILKR